MPRLAFRLAALAVVAAALSAGTASAGLITYQVQIDTSSFSGTDTIASRAWKWGSFSMSGAR